MQSCLQQLIAKHATALVDAFQGTEKHGVELEDVARVPRPSLTLVRVLKSMVLNWKMLPVCQCGMGNCKAVRVRGGGVAVMDLFLKLFNLPTRPLAGVSTEV